LEVKRLKAKNLGSHAVAKDVIIEEINDSKLMSSNHIEDEDEIEEIRKEISVMSKSNQKPINKNDLLLDDTPKNSGRDYPIETLQS
jgi:hypothetical protein